jgi:CheY-like chemotaxis protein
MAKARVLLVEDDPIQASVTKSILMKVGYEVLLAEDGINAIKLVKSENRISFFLMSFCLAWMDMRSAGG